MLTDIPAFLNTGLCVCVCVFVLHLYAKWQLSYIFFSIQGYRGDGENKCGKALLRQPWWQVCSSVHCTQRSFHGFFRSVISTGTVYLYNTLMHTNFLHVQEPRLWHHWSLILLASALFDITAVNWLLARRQAFAVRNASITGNLWPACWIGLKESPQATVKPTSHTNFSKLSSPEKNDRLHNLHHANRLMKQQLERIKRRITQVIERDGIMVDETTHSDFKIILEENAKRATTSFPPGSFQHLFWEQQQQASSVKNSRSMRWHPPMIKWCIYLRHLSSGAYEALRTSGCVKLPSQRTLQDYTHYVRACPGFSDDVDKQLIEAAKVQTCEEFQKYVVLVMDEMHIKEDLVYDLTSTVVSWLGLSTWEKRTITSFSLKDRWNAVHVTTNPQLIRWWSSCWGGCSHTYNFPMHSSPALLLQAISCSIPSGKQSRGSSAVG